MFKLTGLPISILNRALELYGEPPETDWRIAQNRLNSAEGRIDVHAAYPGISPFGQAVAEYLSGSGPWDDGGEHEDESGCAVAP